MAIALSREDLTQKTIGQCPGLEGEICYFIVPGARSDNTRIRRCSGHDLGTDTLLSLCNVAQGEVAHQERLALRNQIPTPSP